MIQLLAPVQGAVISIEVVTGQSVAPAQVVIVLESMKMEVPVEATVGARVTGINVAVGDAVAVGQPLASLQAEAVSARAAPLPVSAPASRPEFDALQSRRQLTLDAARPDAVARRRASRQRTARENIDDLLDAGSFSEYGAFAVAAQRSRRPFDELLRLTPADGLVAGTGLVQGRPVAVMAYDYTVLAGTQGVFNHRKADRLLDLAARQALPVLIFAEGGGGRPGDVDWLGVAGLDCTTFRSLAALSGQVPLIGIASGRCFAGNAALLGCCDLIIATENSSIGMGGPAMIEGGGLGRVPAESVGPIDVQSGNGVVDLRVDDEAAAVTLARQLLVLFSGKPVLARDAGDVLALRQALPANRNALYDPMRVLELVFDTGSLIELRAEFGTGVLTAFGRIDGHAVAVAASRPRYLGGALDAPACDKLARFMQLADARGLPLVTFVDTPGFMVGPASETTAMVRHAARLFVTAAALRVPVVSIVLRRGYGLGAMALTAGHFHAPVAIAAWPNAEFGAMGIEGAVRLGFRKELEALSGNEREARFQALVCEAIERGEALNMASHLEIDDVIDPADTRAWLMRTLAVARSRPLPPRRPFIDTW